MGNVDAIEASTNGALSENADRLSGVLVTGEWQRCVKTSAGGDGRDKGTYIELTVRAFAGDSSGQGNSCSTTLANFHPEEAGREAARIANLARNPKEGKEGKYTVVFGPPAMANLLNTCGDAASAYSVDAGFSYLAGKVGQKVASENITLSDDGTYPGGLSSASCDDEGFPTRRTKLMEKGVLKTYLHSSYTAEKFKAHLTGNGFYSGGIGGIIPIPTNLIVDSGAYSKDELLREVRRGLYVTNNWYTRFHNYQTGDFSTICRDAIFTIENGEISGSVKGLRVSENMLHIMQSTRGLSKERVWIKWWEVDTPVLLPHFMIDEVQLTKAT